MIILTKSYKATPTDLTLDEQHPFSYRFNNEIVTGLRKAVKSAKSVKSESGHSRKSHMTRRSN